MISGLQLLKNFDNKYATKKEINYTLDSYSVTKGPLRSMQKFVVILQTERGSDPIRPWFGTKIANINLMNIVNKTELELFLRSECSSAISQFFKLQEEESTQSAQTGYDIIEGLELLKVKIDESNTISLVFKFKPLKYESILFSINV